VLGELVPTTAGKWIAHPRTCCHNGHNLGPGQALVGDQVCLGHGGGRTTRTRRTRDQTLPEAVRGRGGNTHCSALDGPATVRTSTAALDDGVN